MKYQNTPKIENLQIIQRLLELGKNPLILTGDLPGDFKKEHLFLCNILQYAVVNLEREFNDAFRHAVNVYKVNLSDPKHGYGFFHNAENLLYLNMQINQIKYAIYGEKFIHVYKFNEDLKELAYKDLLRRSLSNTMNNVIKWPRR